MKPKSYWKVILILGVVLSPLAVYWWIFGVTISSDHLRWAEFGSAMGGVYSPMVAVLTLLVLLRQVALQEQLGKHELDQGYLQQARQDIEFYGTQLATALSVDVLPGKSLRSVLQEKFRYLSAVELKAEGIRELAIRVHQVAPSVFDLWTAIHPILMGLNTSKDPMYVMTFESSRYKLIALLSFQICVALDNYRRAIVPDGKDVENFFSDL